MNNFLENPHIEIDEFGRANGVLLLNKKIGVTSHDIVDQVRRIYGTRKVGHAGTLDPFAEGLLVILVGKSTSLSNELLDLGKEYEAEILFGISTDSSDIEGKIDQKKDGLINEEDVKKVIGKFTPEYNQYVPVFSSVKVEGHKLRVLARRYNSFEIDSDHFVTFKNDNSSLKLPLPSKLVKISKFEINELNKVEGSALINKLQIYGDYLSEEISTYIRENKTKEFSMLNATVSCSKGTYIRQLARDLGEATNIPAMLTGLKRTKIGNWKIEDAQDLDDLKFNQ